MATKAEITIDPKKRVTVYATDKATHHTKEEQMLVGEQMAKKLVEAGKATFEKPKPPTV